MQCSELDVSGEKRGKLNFRSLDESVVWCDNVLAVVPFLRFRIYLSL